MALCTYCRKTFSFLENITQRSTQRCHSCNVYLRERQGLCYDAVSRASAEGEPEGQYGMYGIEKMVYAKLQEYHMPHDIAQPVLQSLQRLHMLSDIRYGNIPIIQVDMHLDSDEKAHFSFPATYHKPNQTIRLVTGRITGTSKKLYFVSETGKDSTRIDWNNVTSVSYSSSTVHISVSRGSGGGTYSVSDPLYVKVMIDALVIRWKRQLVLYKEQATQGAIPEHIKVAVFQRDQGRCVQCGYRGTYIEYDHIFPRSKGGANTVENVQLLCRMCNLKKSNKI